MLSDFWKKFKSGTDIRGTAAELGMGTAVDLTDEVVILMAKGFASFLRETLNKQDLTIAIGHDSRVSADRLTNCVTLGLTSVGVNVVKCGLCSTPSMFMILKSEHGVDGSIMLTASHHPANKNGLKFFKQDGGLEGRDIEKILKFAEDNDFAETADGNVKELNFMSEYSDFLYGKIKNAVNDEFPLKGFNIIVDAGNGAGGFYAEVLKKLGADTSKSQFLEPDGMFPNHIPNPENKEAMKSIKDAVKRENADLGIIFDTDVDRAGAVLNSGEEINRNALIALISKILLKEKSGATIVTDSITSDGLTKFIEGNGGKHHRFKRGYKNVIDEAKRLNESGIYCPLAIETSGHAALKENYFLDDGAYLITRLIIEMAVAKKEGRELMDLIEGLEKPLEEVEIRLEFVVPNFKELGFRILDEFEKYASCNDNMIVNQNNYEGVRVSFSKYNGDGWMLARMSLHDPIMPINIESNTLGGTKAIAKQLYDFMRDIKGLDVSNLKKFILK